MTAVTEDHAVFESDAGYIKVAIIDNKNGKECWIYELEAEGVGAAGLMSRARRQAKEWGFDEVHANVSNARLVKILNDHGWIIEQVILKGRT